MRNKFAGSCRDCACQVEVGVGYFERHRGAWRVRCIACTAAAKANRGAPLSNAQRAALTAMERQT